MANSAQHRTHKKRQKTKAHNPATFLEFFCGGGMARAGLGAAWKCLFANDNSKLKAEFYSANWGSDCLIVEDIHRVTITNLPGSPDLAWASFPCQDLSCAGAGLGIGSAGKKAPTRSGTFWPFVALMRDLGRDGRAPKLIVVENVLGLLSSNSGRDFLAVTKAIVELGYRVGAIVVDARHFVPQSRPRLFFVAISAGIAIPPRIIASEPTLPWHTDPLKKAYDRLPTRLAQQWIWWNLGEEPKHRKTLAGIVSDTTKDARWDTSTKTNRLLALMSPINKGKLRDAKKAGRRQVASLYMRMRPENDGTRQRAEIKFSKTAGCIRTPKGGGSRQRVLIVRGEEVRSRLLSPLEGAALMGLDKRYKLPTSYDHAYRLLGDGVVVPAVAFIRERLLDVLLVARKSRKKLASKERELRKK